MFKIYCNHILILCVYSEYVSRHLVILYEISYVRLWFIIMFKSQFCHFLIRPSFNKLDEKEKQISLILSNDVCTVPWSKRERETYLHSISFFLFCSRDLNWKWVIKTFRIIFSPRVTVSVEIVTHTTWWRTCVLILWSKQKKIYTGTTIDKKSTHEQKLLWLTMN